MATCLERQLPPPKGSASLQIAWGDYTFYAEIPPIAVQSTMQQVTVQRIQFPGGVTLMMTAQFPERVDAADITVVTQVGGQAEQVAGRLFRTGESTDNLTVYRGTVTIRSKR